jgi:hypothetical protein
VTRGPYDGAFKRVIVAVLVYRDADTSREFHRARRELGAAILRWWYGLPPDAEVIPVLPVRFADAAWRRVTDAAIEAPDEVPHNSRPYWRLYKAAGDWAAAARFLSATPVLPGAAAMREVCA